jgi:hypothetical protein
MVASRRKRCGATMTHDIWNMPSGRSRRWARRKNPGSRMPAWARYFVWVLLLAVSGTLLWEGAARWLNPARKFTPPEISAAVPAGQSATAAWQRDVASSLEGAVHEAGAGNITQAEVAIDRAVAFVTGAKFRSETAASDFFGASIAQLDRAVAAAPENARLTEHAALMRIELAQLRSSLETALAESRSLKKVAINSPRSISRDSSLDPASLGGNFLDATLMPFSAEILEPPSSRLFVDNVRVENLTLAGAAQTLDGIHWRNVTFTGTRLRYQGGEVDLQNVHFVRCTFGFANGDRGARLATAIALGQTSIVIP